MCEDLSDKEKYSSVPFVSDSVVCFVLKPARTPMAKMSSDLFASFSSICCYMM